MQWFSFKLREYHTRLFHLSQYILFWLCKHVHGQIETNYFTIYTCIPHIRNIHYIYPCVYIYISSCWVLCPLNQLIYSVTYATFYKLITLKYKKIALENSAFRKKQQTQFYQCLFILHTQAFPSWDKRTKISKFKRKDFFFLLQFLASKVQVFDILTLLL